MNTEQTIDEISMDELLSYSKIELPPQTALLMNVSDGFQEYRLTSEDAAKEAIAAGLIVEFPKPNELQLDIDNEEDLVRFNKFLNFLVQRVTQKSPGKVETKITKSSGGNYHVRVSLPDELSAIERIALQAALGSDPKREILSLFELREGDDTPTLFFEQPGWENTVQ